MIAPFHGASLGKSSAPESGRPDCRIRQNARPGRDSHMAIAYEGHQGYSQRPRTAPDAQPHTPGHEVLNDHGLCLVPASFNRHLHRAAKPRSQSPSNSLTRARTVPTDHPVFSTGSAFIIVLTFSSN